ncbi:glucoamylase [Russula aff. rugulosa BPL654]|nr:glucoamylase [Russula aff. rugulosa BPL654]
MWGLRQFATQPESYHDASQSASLSSILAYASGLTDGFPTMNAYPSCTYARSNPSLKMRLLCLVSVIGLVGTAISEPAITADSYFGKESPIAKAGVLANIGPDGIKCHGAKSGIVIASPSPAYLATWVRDSSLVFKIDHFVAAEAAIQQVPNPSGTVKTGGLGEPKFNIDGSAFTGSLGRPQRDGPALRSTAMITYANWLIANHNASYVVKTLWPIIKLDLDYVATWWNQTTYDLWGEVRSSSFFTTAVQHRSLREGVKLALRFGGFESALLYRTQADNLLCFLQSYWNPSGGYITANTGGGRSGKDSNTILASIHTWDIEAGCDAKTFQPCSDKALSNLKVYVDSFRSIYPINKGINATFPVAVGRYPEDEYLDGNPWYLSTFAVSEQLYDALLTWNYLQVIDVTDISRGFFSQFIPDIKPGTYSSNSVQYLKLMRAIKAFADGFVVIAADYTPSGGGLSEQYDKTTGKPLGAADLTWSYASVMTANDSYSGVKPASWGAKGLVVPPVCVRNTGPQVNATFNVHAMTTFREGIYLAGSVDALKDWSPQDAISMNHTNFQTWSVNVTLPGDTYIEYKYLRKFFGRVTWESGPNRVLITGSGKVVTNDTWR